MPVLPSRYVLERQLSPVTLAVRDRLTGSSVTLSLAAGAGPDQAAVLAAELDLLCSLGHPGIPRPVDAGVLPDGTRYLAVERAAGAPVQPPLHGSELAALVAGACDVVHALHGRGLAHGRLGLDSFTLDVRSGLVALVDLGRAEGRPADASTVRADIRALGAVFREAAAEPTAGGAAGARPAGFEAALGSLLDPHPGCQPSTAHEAARALLAGLGAPQAGPTTSLLVPGTCGRAREVTALRDAVELARDRTVKLALRSEGGAGRTHLVEGLHRRLLGDAVPVLVRDVATHHDHPLADLGADLGLLLDVALPPVRATDPVPTTALGSLCAAVEHLRLHPSLGAPLVLVLENLHAADPGFLADVEALWTGLEGLPVLLLTTHDTSCLAWPPAGEPVLDLPPLSERGVRELLTSMLGGVPAEDLLRAALVVTPRQPRHVLARVRHWAEHRGLARSGSAWTFLRGPADDVTPRPSDAAARAGAALAVVGRPATVDAIARVAGLAVADAASATGELAARELATMSGSIVVPQGGLAATFLRGLPPSSVRALHDRAVALYTGAGAQGDVPRLRGDGDAASALATRHEAAGSDAVVAVRARAQLASTSLLAGALTTAAEHARAGLERLAEARGAVAAREPEGDRGGRELAATEMRLFAVLAAVATAHGDHAEAATCREAQVRAARTTGAADVHAEALRDLARARQGLGDVDGAHDALAEALSLLLSAEAVTSRDAAPDLAVLRAAVLVDLAVACDARGDTPRAEQHLAEAAFLHGLVGDVVGQARVMSCRGRILSGRGRADEAREALRGAIVRFEAAGEATAVAAALLDLGRCEMSRGDVARAAAALQDALARLEPHGDARTLAGTHEALAGLAASAGRAGEAVAHHRAALRAVRRAGDLDGQAAAGSSLSRALLLSGDVPGAVAAGREALRIHGRGDARQASTAALTQLGLALCASAEYADALDCCERAFARASGARDARGAAEACWGLGRIYAALGATKDGMEWQRRALELATHEGDRLGRSAALSEIGPLLVREGDLEGASAALRDALAEAEAARDGGAAALARLRLGRVHAIGGRLGEGLALLRAGLEAARVSGLRLVQAEGERAVGALLCELGESGEGLALLRDGLRSCLSAGCFEGLPASHEALARAHLRRSLRLKTSMGAVADRTEVEEARDHVEKGLDLTVTTGRMADRAALQVMAAAARLVDGDAHRALGELDEAERLAQESGDVLVAAQARVVRSEALLACREFGAALQEAREAGRVLERIGVPAEAWRAHALASRIQGAWGMAPREAESAQAAEALLRRLASSLGDAAMARTYLSDVERSAALSSHPTPPAHGARRRAAAALSTQRLLGQVDPEDLVEALIAARRRADDLAARLHASSRRARSALSRQRLLQRVAALRREAPVPWPAIEDALADVRRDLGAERVLVLATTGDGARVLAGSGVEGALREAEALGISLGLVRHVQASGRASLSRDARVDRRYGDLPSVRALELKSLLCVPLCWDGATRAVLYADHQQREGTFRRRDLRLLAAVADLLGAALEASGAREADEAVSAAR